MSEFEAKVSEAAYRSATEISIMREGQEVLDCPVIIVTEKGNAVHWQLLVRNISEAHTSGGRYYREVTLTKIVEDHPHELEVLIIALEDHLKASGFTPDFTKDPFVPEGILRKPQ